MKADSILATIGNTPHIRMQRLFGASAEVWIKSERSNPGGSIKDRIAVFARRQGQQWMQHLLEVATGRMIASVETQRRDRLEDGEGCRPRTSRAVSVSEGKSQAARIPR